MTTIVYDHNSGKIACDGMLNADGVVLDDEAIKYKHHEDGSVWFFTGSPADDVILMKLQHNDKPEVKPNCCAIYAKDGFAYLVTFDGDYCARTKLEYSHSIGSGWKFALSSLDYGCGAVEAVKYTSKRDCYTGGRISAFDVKEHKFIA